MKKVFNYKWMALLFVAVLSLGFFTSCGDDDDDQPSGIYIQNASSYSFNRFTVVYLNDKSNNGGEIISTQDFGTLNPGGNVTATIPAGATYYYLYMVNSGESYVSADYHISVKTLKIDNNFMWYN